MAGRKRKPANLHVVHGTRSRAPKSSPENTGAEGIPRMPAHLEPKAKYAWKELTKLLSEMGVLRKADKWALETLVQVYARIRELQIAVKENGMTYESYSEKGGRMIKANPEVAMLEKAETRFQSLLSEFGLTPASSSKVGAQKNEVDPLEEFLQRRNR